MRSLFKLLVATLVVALSVVSCSKGESPIEPSPTPSPTGPTADMSGLSAEARDYVMLTNIGSFQGKVSRYPNGVIGVYPDAKLKKEDVEGAMSYWQKLVGDSVSFQLVDASATGRRLNLVIQLGGIPENTCAVGGPDVWGKNHDIMVSNGYFAFGLKPLCMYRGYDLLVIAHEIGHAIGLEKHFTQPGADIMSDPIALTLVPSPVVAEAVRWIYSQEPGATPR